MNADTYKNPWHNPRDSTYGPAEYSTYAKPKEYRGYLIYERISGHVWDVVKDGVCITQRAGPDGARRAIDSMEGSGMSTLQTPLQRARETAAYANYLAEQVRDSNEKSGVAVWYTIGELCACVQTLAHQVKQLTDEDAS